jgi:hypothetical protein
MVKMAVSPYRLGVTSYDFGSVHHCRAARRHLGRHHVTDPAAYRQQGDHEGEDEVAHYLMIDLGTK